MVFGGKSKDDASSPAQWKKKYYDSLDDIEYKEEQWHQVEKLLRNAIVRISLAVDPAHEKLNELLNTLRDNIRDGKDSLNLKVQFDKIIALIRDLDPLVEESESSSFSVKAIVDDCINRVQWTDRAKQFKRGLARQYNSIKEDELQTFIQSFTKLINQELLWYEQELNDKSKTEIPDANVDDNKKTSDRKSELKSSIDEKPELVVDKKSDKESNQENIQVDQKEEKATSIEYPVLLITLLKAIPQSLIEESMKRNLQLKAATCKTRPQALECIELIASSLRDTDNPLGDDNNTTIQLPESVKLLVEFLELITLPDALSTQAETIRQTLLEKPESLKKCLNQTVDLVMALQTELKDERKELETFLSEISNRLREIDEEVKKISGIGVSRSNNFKNVTDSLEEESNKINAVLNEEANIDTLKDSVKSHVIMIRHHMDTFLTEDNKQQKYSDETVEQLARELLAVKQEAEELREQLEHKRLQATHDTLTRIPNRLAYDEWINQEHDRFVKYDTPFVLMVWDVDFFKKVNDGYGHQAGDKVLRVVAQMLSESIREADFVARYGGEEFVVVLPGTTLDAAMNVANIIRMAIKDCAFHFRDKPVKITASAGVAEIKENESVQMLFDRADKALYSAKQSGRNRCIAG